MAKIAVIMGSDSDAGVMKFCLEQLSQFGLQAEVRVLSAHRSPAVVEEFATAAASRGISVIIAAAGMSAALAGAIAARTTLPVIGVAIASGPLNGIDALLSTVQMPPGVPVACAGIGSAGAVNAAVLAAQVLALADSSLQARLKAYKEELERKTLEKDRKCRQEFSK
jgi:phosphoribosylaminoimidazole carboxylase PurE protein